MTNLVTFGCGLIAGLHGACYGAWKDSPHESFRPMRFVRELLIASAAAFFLTRVLGAESPLTVVLGAFALTRISTEFRKLFFRSEEQTGYRIPTEAHCFKHLVSRPVRALMGVGWLLAAYGVYGLLKLLPNDMSPQLSGPLAGLQARRLDGAGIGLAVDASRRGYSVVYDAGSAPGRRARDGTNRGGVVGVAFRF